MNQTQEAATRPNAPEEMSVDAAIDDADDFYTDSAAPNPSTTAPAAHNGPKTSAQELHSAGLPNGTSQQDSTQLDASMEAKGGGVLLPGLGSAGPSTDIPMDEAKDTHEEAMTADVHLANGKAGEAAKSMLEVNLMAAQSKPIPDPEFLEAAAANKGDKEAEWQYDSSDAESDDSTTDSSSSDDDSDDSDDDQDNDYKLLDPAEQARILMEGGDGSDDEGGSRRDKASSSSHLRTANEQVEELVVKPDITITPDMEIQELGHVENIVENYLLVKGKISGETQVLESGSVLCLEDRTVIGSIFEALGRVEEPRYSVAFNNAAEMEANGIAKSSKIFYVVGHSRYVFTQPLKLVKGSDASNIHDEEVGADEVEFSDDEAEAEYKRKLKMEKLARKGIRPPEKRPAGRGMKVNTTETYEYPTAPIKYDDNDDEDAMDDGMYNRLQRPENLHAMPLPARLPPSARGALNGHSRGRGGRDRDRGRGGGGGGGGAGGSRGRGDRRHGRHHHRDERADSHAAYSPTNEAHNSAHAYVHPTTSPSAAAGAWQSPVPPVPSYQPSHMYQPAAAAPSQPWYGPPGGSPVTHSYPASPQPPSTPGGILPPGAFVNPTFFRNQSQSGMSAPSPTGSHPSTHPFPQPPQQGGSYPGYYGQAPPPAAGYDPSRPWMT